MVALSRCLAPLVAFLGACEGARVRSKSHQASTKLLAGIPILNYDKAFEGAAAEAAAEKRETGWVVVTTPDTSDAAIAALCKTARNGCTMQGHPGSGGVPMFVMHGNEMDLEEVLLKGTKMIEFVEPDMKAFAIPEIVNEEHSAKAAASWGLDRVGVSTALTTGQGVHVYVLDTGIHHSHSDFGDRAIPTIDLTGGSLKECNGDFSCAKDAQGHGTHCAGTVAGTSYGVAPAATVHSGKVLGDDGSGQFSWSDDALDFLARRGLRPTVASMSLGGQGVVASMATSIDAATAAGVTVVVAAGNSNSDACGFSPAYVPNAITVGSTTSDDVRSSFSNYGECVDIWAPGSDITSADHRSNGAKTLSGTSMACPHVSGGAALILEASPSLKAGGILDSMKASGATNVIEGLKNTDTNSFLYVGAGGAPPSPTVGPPAPPSAECPSYCRWFCISSCSSNGCC